MWLQIVFFKNGYENQALYEYFHDNPKDEEMNSPEEEGLEGENGEREKGTEQSKIGGLPREMNFGKVCKEVVRKYQMKIRREKSAGLSSEEEYGNKVT